MSHERYLHAQTRDSRGLGAIPGAMLAGVRGFKLLRYLVVGVINTGVGLGTIYLGMYALGMSAESANLVGYCVGLITSFVLNKYWTFGNFAAARMQFVRFIGVMGVAYLVNLAAVEICLRLLRIEPYLAQTAGILPYTLVGYLGCRHFAFPVDT